MAGLSKFVTEKTYLTKSRARRIWHVTTPYENLMNAMTQTNLKLRATPMLVFRVFGLGHLEEEFVI